MDIMVEMVDNDEAASHLECSDALSPVCVRLNRTLPLVFGGGCGTGWRCECVLPCSSAC